MGFDFITIILLLAAAQGFFLVLIIFQKHGKLYANRFLGFLIFIYSLVLLNLFFSDIGYYKEYPFLTLIPMCVPFLLGPLHYLYVKYLTQNRRKISKRDTLHFIPFFVTVLYFMINYYEQDQARELVSYSRPEDYPVVFIVFNWLLIIQVLTYVGLSLFIIRKYSRYFRDAFSSMEQIRLDWIRNITYLVALGLIVFVVENLFLQLGINLSNYFTFSSVVFAIYVYTLGYSGFLKSEIFEQPETAQSIEQIPTMSYHYRLEKNTDDATPGGKYEKSGLNREKAEEYLQNLKTIMVEKQPYTDSNLSLHQLSEMLEVTPHNLSEVINTGLNQNFFDYVNYFRVEKVKKDLSDDQKRYFKLLSIALDAGFNSKSSFNVIFKKQTGMTPSEYRDKVARTQG